VLGGALGYALVVAGEAARSACTLAGCKRQALSCPNSYECGLVV